MHVIDLIAPTLPALLDKLDGYKTKDAERPFTLHLRGRADRHGEARLLHAAAEHADRPEHPQPALPRRHRGHRLRDLPSGRSSCRARSAAVALLTALFGFSVLPISWAGLALILLGVALLVIDAHVVSHGALTLSGLISLAFGMLMLFHNAPAPYHTSVPHSCSRSRSRSACFWAFALTKAVQVRRRPPRRRPAPGRRRGRQSCGRRARSSSTASSGVRAGPTAASSSPGEHVRVAAIATGSS